MNLKSKRVLLALVAMAVIGIGGAVAYAGFTITSNVVGVQIGYSLNLSVAGTRSPYTLVATLTNGTAPVAGVTVQFYYSTNNSSGPWTPAGSATTGSTGKATMAFSPSINVFHWFEATYAVP